MPSGVSSTARRARARRCSPRRWPARPACRSSPSPARTSSRSTSASARKRVRELFAKARRCENGAVVFIDEIDAVGGRRSGGGDGGSREADHTLNQLLAELDGFHSRAGVVVVGATNRLDTLDPALLRPGRFSRQIEVSAPDEAGRLAILRIHAAGQAARRRTSTSSGSRTSPPGNSGAELAEVLNEARDLGGARRPHRDRATPTSGRGCAASWPARARRRRCSPRGEREIVAYHEAGHVLAGELCPTQDRTEHATINPRGRALGLRAQGPHRPRPALRAVPARVADLRARRARGGVRPVQAPSPPVPPTTCSRRTSPRAPRSRSGGSRRASASFTTAGGQLLRLDAGEGRRGGRAARRRRLRRRRRTSSPSTPTSSSHITEALLASGDIDRPEIELAMRGRAHRAAPAAPVACARARGGPRAGRRPAAPPAGPGRACAGRASRGRVAPSPRSPSACRCAGARAPTTDCKRRAPGSQGEPGARSIRGAERRSAGRALSAVGGEAVDDEDVDREDRQPPERIRGQCTSARRSS